MEAEECRHEGEGRVKRVRNGYLGDVPRGFVETLCAGCGSEVEGPEERDPEEPEYYDDPPPRWMDHHERNPS